MIELEESGFGRGEGGHSRPDIHLHGASLAEDQVGQPPKGTHTPYVDLTPSDRTGLSGAGAPGQRTVDPHRPVAGSATNSEFGSGGHIRFDAQRNHAVTPDPISSAGHPACDVRTVIAGAADPFVVAGLPATEAHSLGAGDDDPHPPSGGGEDGHPRSETQQNGAILPNTDPAQVGGRVGQATSEILFTIADPAIIAEIREQWRRRQAWHRAEKSLTLQAKALCRRLAEGGDKKEADVIYKAALGEGEHPMGPVAFAAFFPLTEARDTIEKQRFAVEKRLAKLAKQLPVAPWVVSVKGVSLNGLASVVGGAGDLSGYANPAKLWKRMGLAVMPDGRQRRVAGAEGVAHGYSPSRRSEMWNLGNGLIGGMGKGKRPLVGEDISLREDWSPLEKLFVERLRFERDKDPEKMGRPDTKEGKESFSKHAANRAKRYVEKRFLRQLWQAWRGDTLSTPVISGAP